MGFDLIANGIKSFLDRSTSELAAFIIGLAVGAIVFCWPWLKRKIYKKSEKKQEYKTVSDLTAKYEAQLQDKNQELEGANSRIDELTADLETKQDQLNQKTDEAETLVDEKQTLQVDLAQLNAQLEKLTQLDGDIWQRTPIPDQVPRFRTLSHGKPPIIAVVNLKGGVGKTTITANLAAAAMHLGQSALLVDLDYQNSLSALTLSRQLREDISEKGHFVSELISSPEPTGEDVIRLAQRINDKDGFVIATNEDLTTIETEVMARWITNGTPDDVRFRLRRALHSDKVQSKFDLILIDGPPRLTTACVNALACCDYVLIPALLDSVSTEAVPRLLKWLRMFKTKSQICPNMAVLGVIGNRARNSQGMSTKQKEVWNLLNDPCCDAWGEPVHQFKITIPDNVGFADAATENTFAANNEKLQPVFLDLLSELQQRIPFHAGQGSPAVSR